MQKTHTKTSVVLLSLLSTIALFVALLIIQSMPVRAAEMAEIRVHTTKDADANALPFFGDGHQAGWTIRLYDNNWNPVPAGDGGSNEVVTTDMAYEKAANFVVEPGKYKVCAVQKDGYDQAFALMIKGYADFRDWSIANKSTAEDEAFRCVRTKKINGGDVSSVVFGHNMGGEVRVHQVVDLNDNQWPDFLGDETHAKGWKFRLYKVNHLGEWHGWGNVKTTGEAYHKSASFQVAAGEYRLCQVAVDGYEESYVRQILGYVNLPESSVSNESPRDYSENPSCAPISLSTDDIQSFVFGNTETVEELPTVQ